MGDDALNPSVFEQQLREKDLRIQELERCLTETRAGLDTLVEHQIDQVISSGKTIPLLLHHAQQALQRRHEELERIVAERTIELEQANVQLTFELDERRRLEERFHTIWDVAMDGMVLSDSQGIVIAANPAYCRLLGYIPEEVINQDFSIIYPESERAAARETYRKVYDSPEIPPLFPVTIRRKDGELRRVETRIGFLTQDGERKAMLSVIRDVTEQRQAEELAQKEHERAAWLARIPDENPNPVARASMDGILQYWNLAFMQAFGPDLKAGQPVPEQLRALLMQAGPQRNMVEENVQVGDCYYLVKIVTFPAENYANIFASDFTTRRAAEEALKKSEERFRAVFEKAGIGIVLSDLGGSVLEFNPAFENIMGATKQELYNQHFSSFTFPDDLSAELALVEELKAGKRADYEIEKRYIRKDGQVINVRFIGSLLNESQGKPPEGLGLIEDITARKQAEEALRKSEEKFSRAFRSTPVSQVILRAADHVMIDVNDAFLEQSGFTREEAIGHTALDLGLFEDPSDRQRMAVASRGGPVRNLEIRSRTKTGGNRTHLFSFEPIELNGEDCLLLTGVDITDRKLAEQAIKQVNDELFNERNRLLAVMEALPVGLAILDNKGGEIQTNTEFNTIWGSPRPQAGSVNDYGRFQAWWIETGEKVKPEEWASAQVAQQGKTVTGQYFRVRKFDGSDCYVINSAAPVRDAEGRIIGSTVAIMDITERVLMEKALKERGDALEKAHNETVQERNRLLAVMEALPVGLAIYDEKGALIQSNQSYEGVWGSPRPPADSIQDYDLYKSWWVESGERVKPEEWAAARAVQAAETITGQFIRIHKFDGSEGYVLNSGAPVRDGQGNIIGATVAIMDITDRVRAETELRESQGRFRVALASAPILVFNCDRDLRYTWISQPLPGFVPGEAIGKRDEELAPDGAVDELIAAKQWVLSTGQNLVREIALRFKGQVRHFVLAMEPARDEKGEPIGIIGSAIEITEQKRLEMEQKEKVIQSEIQRRLLGYREKERLQIAQELHDGPIQVLAGTIFHIQATKEAIADRYIQVELEQALVNIKSTVRELRDIMNELRPPAVIRFGLAKSARMHAEDFRDRHPGIRLELTSFEDGTTLPEPMRLALFRIYQESLSNISKHADATHVWVRITKKGSKVHLQIRDNGAGFKVEPDLVGLTQLGHYGLAGMKERAEAIGGSFQVSSAPGQGTTIHVIVPIDDVETAGR